jgi:hypothetical protein
MILKHRPWQWLRLGAVFLLSLTVTALPAAAQPFIEGTHYWFGPALFPGKKEPKDHPRGPALARGLVIWNGGYDSSRMALEKVPPIVQYFAEAGWDTFNLRRHTSVMGDKVPVLILDVVARAKATGYKRILLFGQSRGAFASIQVGSYKADIHGILPLAPAGFGDYGRSSDWRQNDFYIRSLWDSYKGSRIHVAAGFFTGDDWYETKHPHVRGPYATRRLTELGVPNFIISQPDYPGMSTHSGGTGWEFARRYGPCLDLFFETGKAPPCEDADPATSETFKLPAVPLPVIGGTGFTGIWQGTSSTGRYVRLIIPPMTEGRSEAFYQTGRGVDLDRPGSTKWGLVARDGRLIREADGFEFRIAADGSDKLQVTYVNRKVTPVTESGFAILHRIIKR